MELNKLGYTGKLLIEKPAFSKSHSLSNLDLANVFVGYELRFHPVIQKLRAVLTSKEIYSIQVYVGQYLPSWRPGTDYTKCYSSSKAQGGGALRDLSHELDYINWLCGGWKRVAALGGKFSDLQIDSDDIFVLLLEMKNCPIVCIQMNYLDRNARREIIINLKNHTIKADLINNSLETDGELVTFEVEQNQPYIDMHESILEVHGQYSCSIHEGLEVLGIIEAAEKSAKQRKWFLR
jgi:predicted dehydrogenase